MSAALKPATIFPSWHFGRWHAVDDRVRGGSSQSHLDPVPVSFGSTTTGVEGGETDDKAVNARFWGTLDTKTLGGAGFASQRYIFGPEPLHLPRLSYGGIILRLLPDTELKQTSHTSENGHQDKPAEPHTFTLVLKTSPPQRSPDKPKLPPNPEPASLSYEHDFSLPSTSTSTSSSSRIHELHLAFNDFKPTYRGREVPPSDPKYRPFDSNEIFELSVMCRSAFGKQEGEFGIVLVSMEGWEKGNQSGKEREREGCWEGMKTWAGSWWTGERGVKL